MGGVPCRASQSHTCHDPEADVVGETDQNQRYFPHQEISGRPRAMDAVKLQAKPVSAWQKVTVLVDFEDELSLQIAFCFLSPGAHGSAPRVCPQNRMSSGPLQQCSQAR